MITVFGSLNLDFVLRVPRLPVAGETAIGERYALAPGGKGANQAAAAAKAGARVAMAGRIGGDAYGETLIAALRQAGVTTHLLKRAEAPTGAAFVVVDHEGRNQIAVARGANGLAQAADVPRSALRGGWLLLQMEVTPAENWRLLRRARQEGAKTMLNAAPAAPVPEEALHRLDYLVVNEVEAVELAGRLALSFASPVEAAREIARAHRHSVVVSLGPEGAAAFTPEGNFRIDALSVEAVDTTGAGDAFVGALAAALDEGQAFPAALRFASVAGALACTKEGAMPSLPARAAIEARLPDLAPARAASS